jgi:hypothetical protein
VLVLVVFVLVDSLLTRKKMTNGGDDYVRLKCGRQTIFMPARLDHHTYQSFIEAALPLIGRYLDGAPSAMTVKDVRLHVLAAAVNGGGVDGEAGGDEGFDSAVGLTTGNDSSSLVDLSTLTETGKRLNAYVKPDQVVLVSWRLGGEEKWSPIEIPPMPTSAVAHHHPH